MTFIFPNFFCLQLVREGDLKPGSPHWENRAMQLSYKAINLLPQIISL